MAVVGLATHNPFYGSRVHDWKIMRDAYAGERRIKEKGADYLPPTTSQVEDGMSFGQQGLAAYEAYKARAVYHELLQPAMEAILGVMHRKDADIELPKALEGMREHAGFGGESLQQLLVKINEHQMWLGRIGLLGDIADKSTSQDNPYIIMYEAEKMINWDSTKVDKNSGPRRLSFVVLDETSQERTAGLSWQNVMKYRILGYAPDVSDVFDLSGLNIDSDGGYVAAELRNTQDASYADFYAPNFMGQQLGRIPFEFVGPRDLVPEPDKPLLLPLARLALTIYRTEADYRQALYMQGQDTLVITGESPGTEGRHQVGAFGSISLPMGGTAEYIGADSNGISDLRTSIDSDFGRADRLGAQILAERGNEAEAAGALNIRVASRTATISTMADTGAAGLERILRACAEWKGADPDQVHVNPNKDFVDDAATAQDLTYLMTGKTMGAPLSKRSIHGWLARREFTDMTYEQEQAAIDAEGPSIIPGTTGRGAPGERGPARPAGVATPPAAPVPGNAPRGAKDAARAAGAGSKKN